jgi:hypothetical protein
MNWQKEKGYNQRLLIEARIGRWKTIIRGNLQARKIDNQNIDTGVPQP